MTTVTAMNGRECLCLADTGRCLWFSNPVDYLQYLLENGFHHAEISLEPVCPRLEASPPPARLEVPSPPPARLEVPSPSPARLEDLCSRDETSYFVNERVESAKRRSSSQVRLQITDKNQDLKGHLLYACVHGLTTALQLVLNSAQDINLNALLPCTNEQGFSPLAIAAMSPSSPCCELLLKGGANLDWSDDLGRTALHWAVLAGRLPSVKVLLKHGASPSATDKEGFTPLLYATLTGAHGIVSTVLREVSVDNCHGPTGLSPLMCACMNGDTETVKLLLKHGADPTRCDQHQQSPLHYATWGGSLKAIKLILAHNPSVLSLRDDWGRTAFMVAAAKGDVTIFQYLLKKGSQWNETDYEGRTTLHWAILSKQHSCVENMLEHRSGGGCGLVNLPDSNGATPVHYTAMTGREDTLNLLIAKNGDVSVRDHNGYTPLLWAAMCGKTGSVKLLLQRTTDEGHEPGSLKPLHAASCVGALGVCQTLLDARAMVNVVGPNGMTPLHYSCRYGHSECVRLLLSAGAHVDSLNNLQESGVHLASLYGHASVVSHLSEHGVLKDKDWLLHLASSKGHTEVLRILLNHGCWVDYPCDSDGRTSLHLSSAHGHLACCQLVVERGANIHTRDNTGERFTALDLAMLNAHTECAEYLIARRATSSGGKFHRAALTIQTVWKFHRHKRRNAIARQWASVVIQRAIRHWLCQRKARRVRLIRERARNRSAAIIQYHWRLYITKRRRYEATYTKLKAKLQQEHLATTIILSELHCQTQSVRLPTPARTKSFTSPTPPSPNPRYLLKASSLPPIPLFPSGSILFPSKPRKPLIRTVPVISIAENRRDQPPEDRPLSTIPEEEAIPQELPPLPVVPSLVATKVSPQPSDENSRLHHSTIRVPDVQNKLPFVAHNGSIVSAPEALKPTETSTVEKVRVELPPLPEAHTEDVVDRSTEGSRTRRQRYTTRQSVFKDVPLRLAAQRQRDQGDAAVDHKRVWQHAQRYDKLNEVLSLLQQARESRGRGQVGDLKEQIQTALDEAIRLRADTEALQSATGGLQTVL